MKSRSLFQMLNSTYLQKIKFAVLCLGISLSLSSCDDDTLNQILSQEDYKVAGLKSLLSVSADTSVAMTSKVDGFYQDAIIKVLFPPEARVIESTLRSFGFNSVVDDFVLKMNRSAEKAAVKASPILLNSITSMSITDAANIITGTDSAATNYLRGKTYVSLKNAFRPDIQTVLDEDLVGGASAQDSWNAVTTQYNTIRNNPLNVILNLPAVNTDLTEYVTDRAMSGLFVKLRDQEKKIRDNPAMRVTEAIRKIFQ